MRKRKLISLPTQHAPIHRPIHLASRIRLASYLIAEVERGFLRASLFPKLEVNLRVLGLVVHSDQGVKFGAAVEGDFVALAAEVLWI